MPYLKTCCCNCSLKNGTLIIGCITLISDIIFFCSAFLLYELEIERSRKGRDATAIGSSIQIILSVLLIIGTFKGKRHLLLPWIIINVIGIVLYVILTFFFVITELLPNLDKENGAIIIIIVVAISIPLYGLVIYFLLVVISHYQELAAVGTNEHHNFLPLSMHSNSNEMTPYVSVVTA